ncbi:hypothetical protein C8R47DRAFT_1155861 [Mycena vitilis]|nr:hypothetical protein C8R47DRAFT_1155861 [Mycena vitilis]
MSLEALNSDLRAEESLPADTPAPRIAADGSSSGGSGAPDIVAPNAITGSASLNSSNPNDRFPASFIDANIDANAPSSPSTLPAPPTDAHLPASKNDEVTQGDADSTPGSEGAIQQEQEDGREGKEEGQGEEHKKPKLMQRLKEKMHIRHPHA